MTTPFERRTVIAWISVTTGVAATIAAATWWASRDLESGLAAAGVATVALAVQLLASTILLGRARVALRRQAGSWR